MRVEELIVYREWEDASVLHQMAWLMEHYGQEDIKKQRAAAYACMHKLLEMAGSRAFYGNLWHCYLTELLVNNENSYSKACEIREEAKGSISEAALHDAAIFRELFAYDFTDMAKELALDGFSYILSYKGNAQESKVYNTRIRDRICTLAAVLGQAGSAQEMKAALAAFYKEYGVGKFGLHKAFRAVETAQGVQIAPVLKIAHVRMDDLIGYDIPKRKLIQNTEAFVSGRKANNCLLFGDAGTGKSSCIKAIANEYYGRGLRIIELYKHQFGSLHDIIAQVKNRNYKFIIYMDDLSFEEFETEYKYLKAVIEGGLEKKPENVLIYATSNRRHLVKETFADKEGRRDVLHASDTVQEKLSLASRFGVTIFFCAPDKKEYEAIVTALAQRNGITLPKEQLLAKANQWELAHGGPSGRCAQQFIDFLAGQDASLETQC